MENINDVENLNIFVPGMMIVLLAKRFYGKTVLCRQIIKNMIKRYAFNGIYLISDTSLLNKAYKGVIKDQNTFTTEQMDDTLEKIMAHQINNGQKRKNIMVVIDDIDISKVSKPLAKISTQGRHYGITILLSIQHGKLFYSPPIRANTDCYLFGEIPKKALSEIFASFVTIFDDFKYFFEWYRKNVVRPIFCLYNSREPDREKRMQLVTCKYEDKILIAGHK